MRRQAAVVGMKFIVHNDYINDHDPRQSAVRNCNSYTIHQYPASLRRINGLRTSYELLNVRSQRFLYEMMIL